jgi:hypothetical protein
MHQVIVAFYSLARFLTQLVSELLLFSFSLHTYLSVIFIQFFSPLAKVKDEKTAGTVELGDSQNHSRSSESSFVNMAAGAADDASHLSASDERKPLLPI